ncbi:AI-2E family transporter [Acetobacterium bakii]|uniref:Permease n=1 Tax=Acetobacterium bakii TaxID=52689 RepID=A0A0L6U452_9FIRM|nr:AI-2E family transporter [Acetobacterium bakii]KNZ43283.1 permease [Acetobacterium bakii]
MQVSPDKKRLLIINIIVVLVIGILIFMIWPTFKGMISPFFIAVILAYLLNPLVGSFERRGFNRGLSVLIVFVVVLVLVISAFMSFIPSLIASISGMISSIPNFISQLQQYSTEITNYVTHISNSQISNYFNIEEILGNVLKGFGTALQGISNAILQNSGQLMNLIIIPLVTIFILLDKEFFINGIMYLVPLKYRNDMLKMCCDIDLVIGGFIKGQGLTSLIAGIATGIGAFALGIPYASIIGVVAGITTMIPYFGPVVGTIVIAFIVLFTKPMMLIPMLIVIAVVQVVCGNFLAPKLMSGNVGLHPVFIIFSIFFFGAMFGGVGMIMAVPLLGTIKVIGGNIIAGFASNELSE